MRPVLVVLSAIFALVISRIRARVWKTEPRAPGDCWLNPLGLLVVIVYLSVTDAMLHALICEGHPDGLHSVASPMVVICWQCTEHCMLVALIAIKGLCYQAPMLAIIAWATAMYLFKAAPGSFTHLHRFKFIFGLFTPACYHRGFCYLRRNLCTALVPVAVPGSRVWLMMMKLCILSLHLLIIEAMLLPSRTRVANFSSVVMLACLLLFLQTVGYLVVASTSLAVSALGMDECAVCARLYRPGDLVEHFGPCFDAHCTMSAATADTDRGTPASQQRFWRTQLGSCTLPSEAIAALTRLIPPPALLELACASRGSAALVASVWAPLAEQLWLALWPPAGPPTACGCTFPVPARDTEDSREDAFALWRVHTLAEVPVELRAYYFVFTWRGSLLGTSVADLVTVAFTHKCFPLNVLDDLDFVVQPFRRMAHLDAPLAAYLWPGLRRQRMLLAPGSGADPLKMVVWSTMHISGRCAEWRHRVGRLV